MGNNASAEDLMDGAPSELVNDLLGGPEEGVVENPQGDDFDDDFDDAMAAPGSQLEGDDESGEPASRVDNFPVPGQKPAAQRQPPAPPRQQQQQPATVGQPGSSGLPVGHPGLAAASKTPPEGETLFDEVLRETGIDYRGKYASEAELKRGLMHAARTIGERNDDAVYGRLLRSDPAKVYAYLQQKMGFGGFQPQVQPPAPPVQQQQQQSPAPQQLPPQQQQVFDPQPEWNEGWLQILAADDNGNPVLKPEYAARPDLASVPAKYAAAQEWATREQRRRLFAPQPQQQPPAPPVQQQPLTEDRIRQIAAEQAARVGQTWQEYQQQQAEEQRQREQYQAAVNESYSLIGEEKDWAFVDGDYDKGATQLGVRFNQYLQQASQVITGRREQKEWAKARAFSDFGIPCKLDSKGRVVMVGDGVFPAAPNAGQGERRRRSRAGARRPNVAAPTQVQQDNDAWPQGKQLWEELLHFTPGSS